MIAHIVRGLGLPDGQVRPAYSVVAQSRRNRRFESSGHTPGPVDIADSRAKMAIQATDVGAPGILDLRRARTV
ncbi:hypothetical protein [Nocardia sp. NPDC051981]|uniref:hypothetical protein n=1 Tax=Nocardia sp. NPDC051981 TaxID=3155417 RepID=UPI00341D3FA0